MDELCNHNNLAPVEVLDALPIYQAKEGRHKCAVCSYSQGYTLRSMQGELISCDHGHMAPKGLIEDLPESQAGTGRHKCAVCAYHYGVQAALGNNLPVVTNPKMHNFVIGQDYSRKEDIHAQFGGSEQSGISSSKDAPFIFLFTSGSGLEHGYKDNLVGNVFHYFGEGQSGDMTMTRGNKAILNHVENGKSLLVFESLGKSAPVRFVGEFQYKSHDELLAPDSQGQERAAFVFNLERVNTTEIENEVTKAELEPSLEALSKKAYAPVPPPKDANPKQRAVQVRQRRKEVKAYALKRAGGYCECCGMEAPFLNKHGVPFLEVHHIERLADDGLDTPDNVAALTPNCHRRVHQGKDGSEIDLRLLKEIKLKETKLQKQFKGS